MGETQCQPVLFLALFFYLYVNCHVTHFNFQSACRRSIRRHPQFFFFFLSRDNSNRHCTMSPIVPETLSLHSRHRKSELQYSGRKQRHRPQLRPWGILSCKLHNHLQQSSYTFKYPLGRAVQLRWMGGGCHDIPFAMTIFQADSIF